MKVASAGAQNSSFILLPAAMLAIGLDVGVARITYGVALPALARDLQLSLTAAGLLGTLHLVGYLLGTLASPFLNAKAGALAVCRGSHFVFACAMLVGGLTFDITTMAASRFVAGIAAGFGVFSVFVIVFDVTEPEKRGAAGSFVWSGIGVAVVASGLASGPILDGGAWRLSFIVPAALALAVAAFIPSGAQDSLAQPKTADWSPSRLAELVSSRWIFLVAAYFLFAAGYISYATFAGVMLKGIGLASVGVTWFWVMYGASSIAGTALGAALLSGGLTRPIALSAALGSGAIGSLLGGVRRELERICGIRSGRTGQRCHAGDRDVSDPQPDERRGLSVLLRRRHSEPGARAALRTRGRRNSRRLVRAIRRRLVRRRDLRSSDACRGRRRPLQPGVDSDTVTPYESYAAVAVWSDGAYRR